MFSRLYLSFIFIFYFFVDTADLPRLGEKEKRSTDSVNTRSKSHSRKILWEMFSLFVFTVQQILRKICYFWSIY